MAGVQFYPLKVVWTSLILLSVSPIGRCTYRKERLYIASYFIRDPSIAGLKVKCKYYLTHFTYSHSSLFS